MIFFFIFKKLYQLFPIANLDIENLISQKVLQIGAFNLDQLIEENE